MKKTEKIELRVDHAEKERLSAIAERRGQTVSDVVRDALAGELGVASTRYARWPGVTAISALIIGVVALVLALVAANGKSGAPEAAAGLVYPDTVQVRAKAETFFETGRIMGQQDVSFDMPLHRASERVFELDSGDGNVARVALTTGPDKDGLLFHVKGTACWIDRGRCDMKPLPDVSLRLRPVRFSRAENQARLREDMTLEIEFVTLTERLAPADDNPT